MDAETEDDGVCTSTFLVSARTGESLRCHREDGHNAKRYTSQRVHSQYAYGILWSWSDAEAARR